MPKILDNAILLFQVGLRFYTVLLPALLKMKKTKKGKLIFWLPSVYRFLSSRPSIAPTTAIAAIIATVLYVT